MRLLHPNMDNCVQTRFVAPTTVTRKLQATALKPKSFHPVIDDSADGQVCHDLDIRHR